MVSYVIAAAVDKNNDSHDTDNDSGNSNDDGDNDNDNGNDDDTDSVDTIRNNNRCQSCTLIEGIVT